MKQLFSVALVLATSLGTVQAFGGASLQYPLLSEQDGSYVLLSSLNSKLEKAGLKGFPDRITLTSAKDAQAQLNSYEEYAPYVAGQLGLDGLELVRYSLNAVTDRFVDKTLCYTGDAHEAVALIDSLTDIAFSDQQGQIGYRYKDQVVYRGEVDPKDIADELPIEWKTWEGQDESILYLWHESDDGDDVNVAFIPRCN